MIIMARIWYVHLHSTAYASFGVPDIESSHSLRSLRQTVFWEDPVYFGLDTFYFSGFSLDHLLSGNFFPRPGCFKIGKPFVEGKLVPLKPFVRLPNLLADLHALCLQHCMFFRNRRFCGLFVRACLIYVVLHFFSCV